MQIFLNKLLKKIEPWSVYMHFGAQNLHTKLSRMPQRLILILDLRENMLLCTLSNHPELLGYIYFLNMFDVRVRQYQEKFFRKEYQTLKLL